jgi:hypothetical protein
MLVQESPSPLLPKLSPSLLLLPQSLLSLLHKQTLQWLLLL